MNPAMQTHGPIHTYKAKTAISRFLFVAAVIGSLVQVTVPESNNSNLIVGVSMDTVSALDGVGVLCEGIGKVTAGESITAGDLIGSDISGKAIKWRGGSLCGVALSSASADEYVSVELMLTPDQSIIELVAATGGVTLKTLGIAGATAGEVTTAGADQASKILGVILNTAAAGGKVFVKTAGRTKLTASAAISYGDTIGSAASGQAKTYSAGQQAGLALSAAGGAGVDIDFLVSPRI